MGADLARQERYLAKIDKRGPDECWPWTAFRNPFGYGMFRAADGARLAHRWGYEQFVGPIGDLHVCHTCDNPACQNPRHWFLGTPADNCADKVAKNRQARVSRPGESNAGAKLSEQDVHEIRRRYLAASETQQELAVKFGVSRSQIGKIVRDTQWVSGSVIDGSSRRARGQKSGRAKLTDQQRHEIRVRYAAGGISQSTLAAEFGVSQRAISAVISSASLAS